MHLGQSHHREVGLERGYQMASYHYFVHRIDCNSGQNYLHALGHGGQDGMASRSCLGQCVRQQSEKEEVKYHVRSVFLAFRELRDWIWLEVWRAMKMGKWEDEKMGNVEKDILSMKYDRVIHMI